MLSAQPTGPQARARSAQWIFTDNNKKVDGTGTTFMTPKRVAKAEAKAAKKQRSAAKRAARAAKRRAKREAQREARRARAVGVEGQQGER